MTILGLMIKLRDNLRKANQDNFYKENIWITQEEIHCIRMAVKDIELLDFDKTKLNFLESCVDFRDIYTHFYYDQGVYDVEDNIRDSIGKLIIYFMKNEYEVTFKRIETIDMGSFGSILASDLERLEESLRSENYGNVTTLSSSILQSLYKEICNQEDIEFNPNDKFPKLYKKIQGKLNLFPTMYVDDEELRNFCSSIEIVNNKINEIRNIYSDSHGSTNDKKTKFNKIEKHHYKLIVDTTKTIVNFMIGTYFYQKNKMTF
ncbi:MAG: abortive infection family protein [Anaerorhabdus sp.]|uniref:abortive infection family protein n=1 Tax=Anaerorhabdus sp. TaxID=1872524 RepID=UPI003A847425